MIERYTLPRMASVWSEESKFEAMMNVEILACEAMVKLGKVPKHALFQIKKKARFDVDRIHEIEEKTHHDVISFIQCLAENIGDDAKYLHVGLTSSDCLDTALAVQMQRACDILIEDIKKLILILKQKARRYKYTLMMGRTHSVHAEPITLGLKFALWYDEMLRNLERMKRAREAVSVGAISGAVGTYANVDPFVEKYVCSKLKIKPARISTQVVQRDHHAELLIAIAMTGSALDKFATEIRNLQHTEIGELEEPFAKSQKGSSAMPHKKNPIICERVCGLARILRANALVAMENIPLWHERDISHSSVERVILPDSTIALDYMLNKFIGVIAKIVVNEDRMAANMDLTKGVIFSQKALLALVDKGMTRQEAYGYVQRAAFTAKEDGVDFKDVLLQDTNVRRLLNSAQIEGIFSYKYHLKNVDTIFKKLLI
ncbi:MAG: adenylosuccinate lyase [Candidatus Omnitrophota bacterium]